MIQDKAYRSTADANRGRFTEGFAFDQRVSVFGAARVWRNVNLHRAKGERVGEIDVLVVLGGRAIVVQRSEEHTSELQSLMRISYAVFCLKKQRLKNKSTYTTDKRRNRDTTV